MKRRNSYLAHWMGMDNDEVMRFLILRDALNRLSLQSFIVWEYKNEMHIFPTKGVALLI